MSNLDATEKSSDPDQNGDTLANIIGDVYTYDSVYRMLGENMVDFDLLALPFSESNELVYPTFQFDGRAPRQDVLDIVGILLEGAGPWTVGVWLKASNVDDEPDRRTALELLDAGEYDMVVRSAMQDAHRWSQ